MNQYNNMSTAAQTSAYLLGLAPMPPPTGRELAVAQLQASLDGGMFDHIPRFEQDEDDDESDEDPLHAGPHRYRLPPVPSTHAPGAGTSLAAPTLPPAVRSQADATPSLISVKVPIYGAQTNNKKAPTLTTVLVLPSNIPPDDFFSRVHAQVNVNPATATLGWKESAECRRDPYHRLSSAEDLQDAFKEIIRLQKSARRQKAVVMEVVNLSSAGASKRGREESSDDDSDDDGDVLLVSDVLRALDEKYPALNYLQYAESLKAKGIVYARSALDFDKGYYKQSVGMADGAIGNFIRKAGKMVRTVKRNAVHSVLPVAHILYYLPNAGGGRREAGGAAGGGWHGQGEGGGGDAVVRAVK
ncbi:hypothetical protein C8J57DRAFT_1241355 [Mycena rebaudengoi]|nr:hypothetical protein C8J57DRAFT_1241355 [Mycena rebaudengoi]